MEIAIGELGETLESIWLLTWVEFSFKCQGLLMKYQRLSVLTRQLAAVFINVQPGIDEPVNPEKLWPLAFDEIKPEPKVIAYTPEEWQKEQERLNKKFKALNG